MFRISGFSKLAAVFVAGIIVSGGAFAQRGMGGYVDPSKEPGVPPQFRQRPAPQQQQAPAPVQQQRPQFQPRPQAQPQFQPQPQFRPRPQPQIVQQPQYIPQQQFRPRPQPQYYPQPVPVPVYPQVQHYPTYVPEPVYDDYREYRPRPRFRPRCVIRRVWVDTRFGPRRVNKRVCAPPVRRFR